MALGTQSSGILRFATFEVDLRAGELRKQGKRIKVQEQPFHVLTVLLQRPGEVVTREELRNQNWPPDTFVDFDNSLNTAINKLREALGDSADNPRFIETLPRRGYRFLAPVSSEQRKRSRSIAAKWVGAGATTVVVVVAVAGGLFWRSRQPRRLTDKDTIVLADFTNATGDSVFDGTLRQALSVQLEQSPFLSLISDEKIHQTLTLMKQPADAKLTSEISREICQRTGSTAVLDGSIAQIGTQYSLILRAVNCASDESIASTEAHAGDKNHVLDALGKASSRIRRKLGESLATVQKLDTPLEQATTPSLEALKCYSLALAQRAKGDPVAALPLLQQAIRLDSNFAMAYSAIGVIYYNDWGETTLSAQHTKKAYELRDRVSERERFYVESQYYHFVSGNLEKALQTDKLWSQMYQRDARPWPLLSTIYAQFGQHEDSLAAARQALLRDADQLNYFNLVYSLLALNRLEEAQTILKDEQVRHIDSPYLHYSQTQFAFLQRDVASLSEQMGWAQGKSGYDHVLMAFEADANAYTGHLVRARELSRQSMASSKRAKEKEATASYEAEAALREALVGNRVEAKQGAAEAVNLSHGRDVQFGAALAMSLGGDMVSVRLLANDLAKRFPDDTIVQFNYLPTLRAQLLLNAGDASRSVEVLRGATPYELGSPTQGVIIFALYPIYVRGLAFLTLHKGNEAAVEFKKILNHRGVVMNELIGPLANLQLGRAYVMSGNTAKARAAYQDFLTLWKDADPDIPILIAAKAEFAKLK